MPDSLFGDWPQHFEVYTLGGPMWFVQDVETREAWEFGSEEEALGFALDLFKKKIVVKFMRSV